MTKTIDLRSDTVTRPGANMRRAIAEAVVGDDVFGDDPTTNELESRVASLFGVEAALFVPSGTMGNQLALASITEPGDEVVLERQSHIFNNQVAAAAVLSGIQLNPIDGDAGVITADQIAPHLRRGSLHQPVTRVIAVENTHNRCGGRVFPLEEMRRIKQLAESHGAKVHLDGARLANAVVASGVSLSSYVACADTVSMCFSKGLGAPIGSVVASDQVTIEKARKKRKQFGGGMRQVGILAAAALYALDHNIDRLKDDHQNAHQLGGVIETIEGLELAYPVETNILIIRVDERRWKVEDLLARLAAHGVLVSRPSPSCIRMVTHLDVDRADIDTVTGVLRSLGSS